MALSVVDLYSKVLPKTNCGDCGFPTCLAFAGMVVSKMHPLEDCPHIAPDILGPAKEELAIQYKAGKWVQKDMAKEALDLAVEKASAMDLEDICLRIGGHIEPCDKKVLVLPYFNTQLNITSETVTDSSGQPLSRNEQTFVYIHMARGGIKKPTGVKKSFKEFPNTVSKIVSMTGQVEKPLKEFFSGKLSELARACRRLGAIDVSQTYSSPDAAWQFDVFPKVPVVLLFWDGKDGFEADAKLLFDETVIDHLDIEAIMFMSEHIARTLTGQ